MFCLTLLDYLYLMIMIQFVVLILFIQAQYDFLQCILILFSALINSVDKNIRPKMSLTQLYILKTDVTGSIMAFDAHFIFPFGPAALLSL